QSNLPLTGMGVENNDKRGAHMEPLNAVVLKRSVTCIPMYFMGVGMNIMSIGGIIVAIGDMVDASIVMVHNAHHRLEDWERNGRVGDRTQMLMDSAMVRL